jgi:hypothetical protein
MHRAMSVTLERISEDEVFLRFAGGDLRALREVAAAYELPGPREAIAFALGVLHEGRGRPIGVQRVDGTRADLVPADRLRSG